MDTLSPLPRRLLLSAGTLVIASLALPASTAAASVLTPNFVESLRIPYLAAGTSDVVDGVTVTATVNSADDGGSGRYLHLSRSKVATTLTFDRTLTEIQIRTANHDDVTPGSNGYPVGAFERYDLTWKLAGATQRTVAIINTDEDTVYTVPDGFDTLEVVYSFSEGALAPNDRYGSFIEFWLF